MSLVVRIGFFLLRLLGRYWKITGHEFTWGVRKRRVGKDKLGEVVYFDKVAEKFK